MTNPVLVKICGLTEDEGLDAALDAGADFLGLVFFPPSPRFITPSDAGELFQYLPEEAKVVGLFVDPSFAEIEQVLSSVRLDMIQLHGSESVERIEEIRFEFGHPVMKALSIATAADLDAAREFAEVADWLLFDAKPPKDADRPGGNAVSFDWTLLQGRSWACPWMLAGGLTPETVAEAIRISGATAVDVSSGVESAPGIKNAEKIARFIQAAKGE
jgi:phosphoribosylanthranilate isomerase